jgi:hypothetical protein
LFSGVGSLVANDENREEEHEVGRISRIYERETSDIVVAYHT